MPPNEDPRFWGKLAGMSVNTMSEAKRHKAHFVHVILFFLIPSLVSILWVWLLLKHPRASLLQFVLFLKPRLLSWFVIILVLFVSFFSSSSFFFLSQTSSPPAYLDDEEDEDPFGDYVISKSHPIVSSSRLLGPQWTSLLLCNRVWCAFVLFFFFLCLYVPLLSVGLMLLWKKGWA